MRNAIIWILIIVFCAGFWKAVFTAVIWLYVHHPAAFGVISAAAAVIGVVVVLRGLAYAPRHDDISRGTIDRLGRMK